MSTLVTYKAIDGGDVQEVSPDPTAAGGLALNTNIRAIADSLPRNDYGASTNPTADNDSADTAGIGIEFSKGSRWYNGAVVFECVDPTPAAAVWVQVVTINSGTVNLAGATVNANDGSGSGGGTWNLDGGVIIGVSSATGIPGVNSGIVMNGDPFYGNGGVISTSQAWVPGLCGDGIALTTNWDGTIFYIDSYGCGLSDAINFHFNGTPVAANDGSGSGGGSWFMDGGDIFGVYQMSWSGGGALQDDTSGGTNLYGPLTLIANSALTPYAAGQIWFDGTNLKFSPDGTTVLTIQAS